MIILYTCIIRWQVGFVNFNPYYRNPEELVKANLDSFGIISLTTSDDVLSEDAARDKVRKSTWRGRWGEGGGGEERERVIICFCFKVF